MTATCHGGPSARRPQCRRRRMMLWSPAASSGQQRARVLTGVKAPRSARPPLRGADGLDAGSAYARPDWPLTTMPSPTLLQNDALSGGRSPSAPPGSDGACRSSRRGQPRSMRSDQRRSVRAGEPRIGNRRARTGHGTGWPLTLVRHSQPTQCPHIATGEGMLRSPSNPVPPVALGRRARKYIGSSPTTCIAPSWSCPCAA